MGEERTSGSNAQWVIKGRDLSLLVGGLSITPTAKEISSLNSGRLTLIQGHQVGPPASTNIGKINFSRFPYNVSLEIVEPGKNPHAIITVNYFAERNGIRHPIAFEDVERGHIVVNSIWYALSGDNREEILESSKFFPGLKSGSLSVGDYLRFTYKRNTLQVSYIPTSAAGLDAPRETTDYPAGLALEPYKYQKTGIKWLASMSEESIGGVLADEMGLGKTLQVIAVFLNEVNAGRRNNLVICPSTLMENWRREIKKFAPSLNPIVHHGARRTGMPSGLRDHEIVITTYETVVRDEPLFRNIEWGVVVLDEAQAIKNPEAERTRVIKSLKRRSSFAVTGTPVENSLEDLWSLLDFALPGYLGSLAEFQTRYTDDQDSAESLRRLTTPLILRRRVAEVANDLPDKIFVETALSLSDAEALDYEKVREKSIEMYLGAPQFSTLQNLRMYCCHPNLQSIRDLLQGSRREEFGKIDRLTEIIAEISTAGEKLLVFTSYTEMSDRLCDHISKRFDCPVWAINGEVKIQERQAIIDKFSSVSGLAALVINPRAGGSGLNITAANHVIMYNPEWNPALEMQSIARAYRRGQTRPVTVHYLYYANTVEESMVETSRTKRILADTAIIDNLGETPDTPRLIDALNRRPSI
jgi:SNF2 family DNA or RNA helicase